MVTVAGLLVLLLSRGIACSLTISLLAVSLLAVRLLAVSLLAVSLLAVSLLAVVDDDDLGLLHGLRIHHHLASHSSSALALFDDSNADEDPEEGEEDPKEDLPSFAHAAVTVVVVSAVGASTLVAVVVTHIINLINYKVVS